MINKLGANKLGPAQGVDSQSSLSKAVLFAAISSVIGSLYYFYLISVSSALALARFVPLLWLAASVIGLSLAVRTLRSYNTRVAGLAAGLACLINAAFALIFTFAALIGD